MPDLFPESSYNLIIAEDVVENQTQGVGGRIECYGSQGRKRWQPSEYLERLVQIAVQGNRGGREKQYQPERSWL